MWCSAAAHASLKCKLGSWPGMKSWALHPGKCEPSWILWQSTCCSSLGMRKHALLPLLQWLGLSAADAGVVGRDTWKACLWCVFSKGSIQPKSQEMENSLCCLAQRSKAMPCFPNEFVWLQFPAISSSGVISLLDKRGCKYPGFVCFLPGKVLTLYELVTCQSWVYKPNVLRFL